MILTNNSSKNQPENRQTKKALNFKAYLKQGRTPSTKSWYYLQKKRTINNKIRRKAGLSEQETNGIG